MELLTINEVKKILKVSRQSVYRYIKDGKLKTIKFEGNTRIKRDDLNKFIGIE